MSSLSRRESNLTLEGDELLDALALLPEKLETPWMSRALFHNLWGSAPAQLASSCSLTADAEGSPDSEAATFRARLLRALGDDIVTFDADASDDDAHRVDAYASVVDPHAALRTVLLVRLEQLHGSDQVAIAVRSTDPVERARMNAFLGLLQRRLQPTAPPRRPPAAAARHGDTSAVFLEEPGRAKPPTTRARSHTLRYRSSGAGISFEGYLNRKSDLLASWRAAYCVLEGDALAYYESREDFVANAKLVGRIQVLAVEDDHLGKPNGFRVLTEGRRASHFSSRTAFEKEQWKRALAKASCETTAAAAASPARVTFGSQPLDVPQFYRLLGALLCQRASDFPLLFQSVHPDVVVTSNFPPIVPFWGQYRRYDGVLLFISTLLESVEVEHFNLLEVLELVRGDADCVDAFGDADAPSSVDSIHTSTESPQRRSASTPTPAWEKRLVVTGKETFHLLNHGGRRVTQLFVHELWLDHKHRLVRWHLNGDAVALSVAFDDAARGENIRLVLPGEASAIAHSIPPGTFYVQILRALQLHPVEQQHNNSSNNNGGGSSTSASSSSSSSSALQKSSGRKSFPVYVRCILVEGTHQERTLDGLDFTLQSGETSRRSKKSSATSTVDKRRPSKSTRLFRGFKRATGISGERSFAPYGDPSGCVTHICKAFLEVDPASSGGSIGCLNPRWASNLRLEFPGCARGFTYFLKLEVFQSRFMLPDEILGVCRINLTPHLSLYNGSADAKANGALPRWHNLCDQYNDCRESWAPPTVFRGRVQVGVIFAPTVASADSLNNPRLQGKRHSFGTFGGKSPPPDPDHLRRIHSDQTLVQSMSAELLREFVRSDRPDTLGQRRVERLLVQSTARSPPKQQQEHADDSRYSGNPQESEVEGQLKRLARDNHIFSGRKTVFDVPKKYQLIKVVGAGTYGEVVAASDVESGNTVAIKKVTNAFADLPDTKRILRELCLLRQLSHPNLVRLHDVLRPERLAYLEDIYLVTDLMETDLHRVVHSTQTLTDEHVAHFMRQLLRALAYLHSADILHRDLKPSNVLVTSTCELKVCDLGLARYVDYSQATSHFSHEAFVELTEYVVTRWYRAPEILLDGCRYDKPADLWSAGCILAELLGRKPLFPGSSTTNQLHKIFHVLGTPDAAYIARIHKEAAQKWLQRQRRRAKIPFAELYPNANLQALDLLEKLLVYDPKRRLSAAQALRHPYLMEAFRSVAVDGHALSESAMRYTSAEEREDTFQGRIDDSHERVAETKEAMQAAVFEQVCHFHPDAAEYERLAKLQDQEFCVDPTTGKLVPIEKTMAMTARDEESIA